MNEETRPPKYPRTPYWPGSPSVPAGENTVSDPKLFLDLDLVITEKLDGQNTLLHRGAVYGRSVSEPSRQKWTAMVKKRHAWKLAQSPAHLYGEDIYGVHSIEYAPVPEERTF